MKPRLRDLGDTALTLELGDRVDVALNARVIAARDALGMLPGITDVVPTYCSLTVHYDPAILSRDELAENLCRAAELTLFQGTSVGTLAARWQIPVLFGGEHGPDLATVARATGRSESSVVETLCGAELAVFMIGFMPGFPYLGELPEGLRLPRRTTPRSDVPPHSVAIAGAQAAIYPWPSPGGWNLLGQTPLRMFDLDQPERPALLAAGDTVRFAPIGKHEFADLAAAVDAGELPRAKFLAT